MELPTSSRVLRMSRNDWIHGRGSKECISTRIERRKRNSGGKKTASKEREREREREREGAGDRKSESKI